MRSIEEGRHELVTIGVDPHPGSLTVSAVGAHGQIHGQLRVTNDEWAFETVIGWAERFETRRWAIEGPGNRYIRDFVTTLLERKEKVYPIAPAMTAQYRSRRARGKDDEIDATNAARALLANEDLPIYEPMEYEAELKDLARSYQRLRRQLTATKLSARQISSKVALASLSDVIKTLEKALSELKKEMAKIVRKVGPELLEICGVGPVVAATVLAEAGRMSRFPNDDHFASYSGAAPIRWASGAQATDRVNPGGNRQLNWALHIIALNRLRIDPATQAYRDKKLAEGKTMREVLRLLKTYIARELYRVLTEAQAASQPTSRELAS